jgi:hypothetical protein
MNRTIPAAKLYFRADRMSGSVVPVTAIILGMVAPVRTSPCASVSTYAHNPKLVVAKLNRVTTVSFIRDRFAKIVGAYRRMPAPSPMMVAVVLE